MSRMGEPVSVRELIAKLEELDTSWGVERTRLADRLKKVAHDVLDAEGDRGVWEQTRPGNGTRAGVADALGTSVAFVQKRSSKHAKRRG